MGARALFTGEVDLILSADNSGLAAGYRMPAEWEPHQATWISWPHNRETWPGCFDAIEEPVADMVAALVPGEAVHINVLDAAHERHVRALLQGRADLDTITFHGFPTNDAWCRDHGAIFVTRCGAPVAELVALDFRYNAWGGKYLPYDLDAAIAEQMAEALEVPRISVDMVLEGGALDVNGQGLLMTTEQCLLHPNRNPELDRAGIEDGLRRCLGADVVIWLGDGIEGDDTDGHVDQVARFVGPGVVVTARESNRHDPNYAPLENNRRRLTHARPPGGALEIIDLPMPDPLFHEGERLPASYANFYVANDLILVPSFGCPQDEVAQGILTGCFPGRAVKPIESRHLIVGLGALHCLTQQVPVVPVRSIP